MQRPLSQHRVPHRRLSVRASNASVKGRLLGGATALVVLAAWWIASESGYIDRFFLPTPLAVVRAGSEMLVTKSFWFDTFISLSRIMLGFAIAAATAIPCGVAIARSSMVGHLLTPPISFIRFVPMPAAIPLMILWFGSGELGKVMIIAAGVFFQAVLMVADAVAYVPRQFDLLAVSVGASPWQRMRHFILPAAAPEIWDALRINFGLAWATLMFAEILGATSGLGFLIVRAQRYLLVEQVYVAVLVIGLMGIASDWIMARAGRAFFPWTASNLRREEPS